MIHYLSRFVLFLQTMDISKMSSGDTSFTSPFKLVATRNDYVHALVAYFDVSFTKCHKLMGFSTGELRYINAFHNNPFQFCKERCLDVFVNQLLISGPRSKATHWKQTVLYLDDVLTISEGEAIIGSMSVEPNKTNPRDVDIVLNYSFHGERCQISKTQYYKMR